MYQLLNKRKTLAVCIAASLISHVISLVFLQKWAFWSASSHIAEVVTLGFIAMDNAQADKILKKSFQGRVTEDDEGFFPQPHFEDSRAPSLPLTPAPIELPLLTLSPNVSKISLKAEFVSQDLKPSFILPPIEPLKVLEHLPKDLIALPPSPTPIHMAPSFLPKSPVTCTHPISLQRAPLPEIAHSYALYPPSLDEPITSSQVVKSQLFSQLPDFPSLADLNTASYSESFDTEIIFSPMDNEKGYIFALTLVPRPGIDLPKIGQHYSFLIDRSNSIQKERLVAVKSAVLRALEELDLEDSFNIIAFDGKIEKLSPASLLATSHSLAAARSFLNGIELGSFFSTTNLYKPLLLTVPSSQDDGLHTAILFSDGESLSKKLAQRELALEWTAYNHGRVSLFAIGVRGDSHLATLDATAAFNRGKVFHAPTKRGIKRKLLKLIKTIQYPIAKDLIATPISRSSQVKILLYPKQSQMPSLYLNEPYVVLGTTDNLDNFILFLQGKLKNQWLNIKKNISFVNAKRGAASLKAEWALQQAYSLYEQYLYDLNPSHLAEAQALLAPHDLPVAFQ